MILRGPCGNLAAPDGRPSQALIALNTIAQVAPLTSPSACKKMFEVVTNGMAELTAPELVSLALSMASLPDTFARKDISTLMTHVVARVADLDPHLMSDLFQVLWTALLLCMALCVGGRVLESGHSHVEGIRRLLVDQANQRTMP